MNPTEDEVAKLYQEQLDFHLVDRLKQINDKFEVDDWAKHGSYYTTPNSGALWVYRKRIVMHSHLTRELVIRIDYIDEPDNQESRKRLIEEYEMQ